MQMLKTLSGGNFEQGFWLGFIPLACLLTIGCDQEPEHQSEKIDTESSLQNKKWARQRETLVKTLTSEKYGISDQRVISAMRSTLRHEFVPDDLSDLAYQNRPLAIGYEQTISQPYIVAFMTEQLDPQPEETVLEIGTGSGYQAAVLSNLVKEVYSIEIIEPLANSAQVTLGRLGYDNVHVKAGDGYQGWPEKAPFDAIIVTCAPTDIPQPLIDQLKEGGKMIIPVGQQGDYQELILLEKNGGQISKTAVLPVRFVPMTGKTEDEPSQ